MRPLLAAMLLTGLGLTGPAGLGAAEVVTVLKAAKGGAALPEASVALIPLDRPAPPVGPDAQVEISQEAQEFLDYVTIVQAGTRIAFPNRDTVQHHVYSLSRVKKFELPLYNPGQRETQVFETAGQVVLGCNIHDWMIAYVVVVPTPWFGKTDTAGRVSVSAPAGRYRVGIWHPRMSAPVSEEITLDDAAPASREFSLTLKPDRRIRRGGGGSKSGGYR